MPKPAGWTLLVCLLISVAIALSGVVLCVLAVADSPTPWLMVAFELLIVLSGVMGVLLGLGRFSEGPALGMLCVAGAVGVGALLGGMSAEWRVGGGVVGGGVNLKHVLLVRGGMSGLLVFLAALIVLSRDWRSSSRLFIKGSLASVALVALLAGVYAGRGSISQLGSMTKAIAAMAGFVLATGLLAAATQWLITAFEMGSASRFEKRAQHHAKQDGGGVGYRGSGTGPARRAGSPSDSADVNEDKVRHDARADTKNAPAGAGSSVANA